jgi:hypothetical protein
MFGFNGLEAGRNRDCKVAEVNSTPTLSARSAAAAASDGRWKRGADGEQVTVDHGVVSSAAAGNSLPANFSMPSPSKSPSIAAGQAEPIPIRTRPRV